jgi:P4 family phage/plasmid primase-like protien
MTEQLADSDVVIIADIDPDGKGFREAAYKRASLEQGGVTVLAVWKASAGKDLSDHFDAGYTWDDFVVVSDAELTQAERPRIDCSNDALAIANVIATINSGAFPELFRQGSRLYRIHGNPEREPLTAKELTSSGLMNILAQRASCFQIKRSKDGSNYEIPWLPSSTLCSAVLDNDFWTVPVLKMNPDRWAIRTPGGTLNLLTREIRPSALSDMHTCQTRVSFDPAQVSCPKFDDLMNLVPPEDQQTLLEFMAYSLTGATTHQVFGWIEGVPFSAKSTVAKLMLRMLGSYAVEASDDLFFGRGGEHPANLSRLEGARLVVQDEIPGTRLRVERLRQHTSQTSIPVRNMRENFRDIPVSWKVLFTSNATARMNVQTRDGIWRRMILFHCDTPIPEARRIKGYENVIFDEEGPAILNKLLALLPAVRTGKSLTIASSIRRRVRDYESDVDVEGRWAEDEIVASPGGWIASEDLNRSLRQWLMRNAPGEDIAFHNIGTIMSSLGYKRAAKLKAAHGDDRKALYGWIGVAFSDGSLVRRPWKPINPEGVHPKS